MCLTALLLALPHIANAEDCSSYPFIDGINIEKTTGGIKIVSTASVGVDFDDVDAVNDARMEAELLAKAKIAKFLTEEIKSEEAINRAVETTKSMQGDDKKVSREETKSSVRNLGLSSAALLKGVQSLGSCLSPGKELRLSVGVKPETIESAESLAANLQGKAAEGVREINERAAKPSMNSVEGFSDAAKLKDF